MLLAGLLDSHGTLPAAYARDGDEIVPGRILLAPSDRHLILGETGVQLGLGPRENLARPAIDPLFRSAAAAFGGRVIGVVLTGMLNDGAAGLLAVKQCGGVAVVQDPLCSAAPDMPRAAIRAVEPDHIVEADELPRLLESLAREEAPLGRAAPPELKVEVEVALGKELGVERLMKLAQPSAFSCPHCHGVLSEVKGDGPLRYRCQTGHAMTADILDDRRGGELEQAMGVALRIMEERIGLVKRLIEDARIRGNQAAAALHEVRAQDYAEQAAILRRAVIATVEARQPAD